MSDSILPFLRDTSGVQTTITACGLRLDISRQRMNEGDFRGLIAYCEERGVIA